MSSSGLQSELAPLEQATKVRREGFTVQPRALAARQVARCRAACSNAAAHGCHLAGFGVKHSPGHHDVLVPELAGPRFGFLHAGAPWMGTARALLGDGCVLLAAGVLDTEPGAAAGEARHGSAHLLEEPLEGAAASRPHCLAVLIPLVDLGRGDTNGTELWPRSHHSAGWGPPPMLDTDTPPGDTPPAVRGAAARAMGPLPVAAGEALDAAAADDSCGGDEAAAVAAAAHGGGAHGGGAHGGGAHGGGAVSPALRAGDALLFDFRLLHKARANSGTARRPTIFLLLARPWWRDIRYLEPGWQDVRYLHLGLVAAEEAEEEAEAEEAEQQQQRQQQPR